MLQHRKNAMKPLHSNTNEFCKQNIIKIKYILVVTITFFVLDLKIMYPKPFKNFFILHIAFIFTFY